MSLVSERFMAALAARDIDAGLALFDPAGEAWLPTAGGPGTVDSVLRPYLEALVGAFPDLRITTKRTIAFGDGVELIEVNVAGTQAAGFLGVINQEKFADVDQAWRFTVADDHITGVHAYWCQNMVYRRLGVKRLDELTITDAVAETRKGAA